MIIIAISSIEFSSNEFVLSTRFIESFQIVLRTAFSLGCSRSQSLAAQSPCSSPLNMLLVGILEGGSNEASNRPLGRVGISNYLSSWIKTNRLILFIIYLL